MNFNQLDIDWKKVHSYMLRGLRAGVYDKDSHGIDRLHHDMQTARVLGEKLGMGKFSVLMALFHPLATHDVITREEVVRDFGEELAELMSCMGKMRTLILEHEDVNSTHIALEDENFRKLILSQARDIRVIICMIANEYVLMHEIRALASTPVAQTESFKLLRHRMVQECRVMAVPIAHRLGLYAIKGEMEDMIVEYDNPEVYLDIVKGLQDSKDERETYVRRFIEPIEARLREVLPVPFHIKGRPKSIASIWNKIRKQGKSLSQIYDLFAIRIIIESDDVESEKTSSRDKALCWQAYSIVADMYQPNPKRLKDWLTIPKSNGYESLHTTVMGPGNHWVEVQIRTQRMDDVAERGFAAHWKYKGIKSQGALDEVMASVREMLECGSDADEIKNDYSIGLYEEEVFVFTPNGDVHKLAKGSTVLDFAFHIHSRLGMQCVGARVGGRIVKLGCQLQSGDTVEVLTSANQTPKRDWLAIVKTSKARNRIKQGLKELEARQAQVGREMLQRRFKNRKIDIDESELSRLINRMGYKNQTDFYRALADDVISVDRVLAQYDAMQVPVIQGDPDTHSASDFEIGKTSSVSNDASSSHHKDDVLVIDRNLRGLDYRLAGCCHPIYGDDVLGFVSVGGGISIHRSDCVNVRNLAKQYPYRIQRARWSGKTDAAYSITLSVVGNDDIGIVTNLSSIINKEPNTLLRSISIDAEGGLFRGQLTVTIPDLTSLTALIRKLQGVKGVKSVTRLTH